MNFFETFPECSLPGTVSKNTIENIIGHHARLKGHCHGILASFYNAEICSCINGNPKIMMQFCYLRRYMYHYTETIYCCLSLSMARIEMD